MRNDSAKPVRLRYHVDIQTCKVLGALAKILSCLEPEAKVSRFVEVGLAFQFGPCKIFNRCAVQAIIVANGVFQGYISAVVKNKDAKARRGVVLHSGTRHGIHDHVELFSTACYADIDGRRFLSGKSIG